MAKDYLNTYSKELVEKHNSSKAQAFQEGGQAPQQQAAPQGGGGQQVDPMEMLQAWGQAMQSQDQETAIQIAMQFTGMMYEQAAGQSQQAANTPAMRRGGEAPSLTFNEKGELI